MPPHLADQERVSVGQPDELLGELAVRTRHGVAAAMHELLDVRHAEPAQADPHHALEAIQLGQCRSKRLGQLATALAEQRQHDDRRRAQRPREVAQEEQRRCVGPLHVIEHEHRRRVASETRQHRRQRCMQLVALGVRVLGLRIGDRSRRVAGCGAQAWQQPRQRPRV